MSIDPSNAQASLFPDGDDETADERAEARDGLAEVVADPPRDGDHVSPVEITPRVATRRVRMTVAYDGAAFRGFAINAGVETVAGQLTEVLSKISRFKVEIVGAGRTDAGVHGWGQVISLDLPETSNLADIARRTNSMLGPRIVVRDAAWTDDDFSARFSALWRHYRYTVLNTPTPSPFLAASAWHVPKPLDLRAMQLGSDAFIGEHDFSSFCRRPKGQIDPVMIRRVLLARWSEPEPHLLRFEIRANAFCHQMVRSIVGTLVEVGLGRRRAGDQRSVLLAQDRSVAGSIAPAQGLCLWEVGYD